MNWINVKDKLPEEGKVVMTWCGDSYKICRYRETMTWKGWKLRFINMMSNGFEADDVTHWMYFPEPPSVNYNPETSKCSFFMTNERNKQTNDNGRRK